MGQVTVKVFVDGVEAYSQDVSVSAQRQVRARPGLPQGCGLAWGLGAALISQMEPIRDARGEAGRCAALAITQAETATMYAVKALTADLPLSGHVDKAKPSQGLEVTRAAGADGAGLSGDIREPLTPDVETTRD